MDADAYATKAEPLKVREVGVGGWTLFDVKAVIATLVVASKFNLGRQSRQGVSMTPLIA
ncbi:MAG: hypothetical protein WAT12_08490 [Candidatus Nitrotoga sp.]